MLDELEGKLEEDYQIGEDIKEKIIPKAVDYFTGKALEYDLMDEDDDDFDEDSDDEEAVDDDSDSDADIPQRRRGAANGRGGASGAGQTANPGECKQQ